MPSASRADLSPSLAPLAVAKEELRSSEHLGSDATPFNRHKRRVPGEQEQRCEIHRHSRLGAPRSV